MEVQEWLEKQEEYNTPEKRAQVTKINIKKKDLKGDLDLKGFVNLKELNCDVNKITSLNVSNCLNIEKIYAFRNQIKKIVGIEKLVNLQELSIGDNQLEKLVLAKNTKLRILYFHTNPATEAEIGKTSYLTEYSGGDAVLSWEGIDKEELNRVARELGIKPELIQNSSAKEIRGLVTKRINELKEGENNQKPTGLPDDWREQLDSITGLKDKVQQAEQFGLTDWNNLNNQTQGETLNSLLARPTQQLLEQAVQDEKNKIVAAEKVLQNQLDDDTVNLGNLGTKLPGYRQSWIDPENITTDDQNTLKGVGYVPETNYQGWINPNDEKARQQAGLKTVAEVDTELDNVAQKLGLDNRNNLTDDNLTNLQEAEKERNQGRKLLRTNNLNNLPQIPENETLQKLLSRPTKERLDQALADRDRYKQERDGRPNVKVEDWNSDWSQRKPLDDYNKLQNDLSKWTNVFPGQQEPSKLKENLDRIPELEKRPNIPITEQQWDEDYSKRPKKTDLDRVQAESDKNKNNLDQANQKVKNYEDGLKDKLGDDALPNWKDEIDKLKNRPTSDNSGPIKGILELGPNENLPTDWPTKLAKKDDLKKWTDRFPNKEPEQVEKELNDLKAKPATTTPNTAQQQKFNKLKKLAEDLCEELKTYKDTSKWENKIVDISKIK